MNRRRFLALLAEGSLITAVIAAASQVVRFLAFEPPNASATVFPVGLPEDLPPGSLEYIHDARAYVGRDEEGLYAVDAVCTHLGCLVEQAAKGGFVCPCHDSRFDAEGRVVTGPASEPLPYLHLWLDQAQGQLILDRAERVEPSVRLIL